jgi:hypothetical protein
MILIGMKSTGEAEDENDEILRSVIGGGYF